MGEAGAADQQGENDQNSDIDDEEEGGEWINEENLHKHLTHGVLLPIVPVESEVAREDVKQAAEATDENPEEEKEEENPDFPAFDLDQLPPMDELDAKEAEIGIQRSSQDQDT